MAVYITQMGEGRNFTPAEMFGELRVVLPGFAKIDADNEPPVAAMKVKLRNFNDEDFLLLSGDPIVIGLSVAVAMQNNQGRIKLLRWDRVAKVYHVVSIG